MTRRRRHHRSALPCDNSQAARDAGLIYVYHQSPGIRRIKHGGSFIYRDSDGRKVDDLETLMRIKELAIPPAWTHVWICPNSRGHLQAVGRDARGRKQYRYHEKWRRTRDQAKYDKMIGFARALPRIRQTTRRDLDLPGLPRRKVLAAIVRIMEKTLIRVGNDEYARHNHSYGLTTLKDRHATIRAGTIHFEFRGKSGVDREIDLEDDRLARIARKCQELPGQELFQYLDDDGEVCGIGSQDVNEYLRQISGDEITAKDFRTWAGTVLAAQALAEIGGFESQAQAKRRIVCAVEAVARQLGNTRAVCRKCYIHPAIIDCYFDGTLAEGMSGRGRMRAARSSGELSPAEGCLLRLLERRLRRRKAA